MDILEFLEENNIDFHDSGKNISTGWIGIKCLFCDDDSNHLGIRLSDLRVSCWKCGPHSIISVIREITGCNRKEAYRLQKTLVAESKSQDSNPPTQPIEIYWKKSLTRLPPGSTSNLPDIHKEYLRLRNFHPNLIKRKYDIRACYNTGLYKFRLIIPVYQNRRLISFTSRAIFEDMEPKYLNPKNWEVEVSPKKSVYNIDSLLPGKDALLLEGVTDVWRFGDGAVSLGGTEYTSEQLAILMKKKIRNLYIMFDNDRFARLLTAKGVHRRGRKPASETRAKEICRMMSPFVRSAEIISSQITNDLGQFSNKQALELRKILRFDE